MTYEDYATGLHAKVAGTWNLHHAAQEQQTQLDCFHSSVQDLWFAYYRQRELRANTVDLGAIQDFGYMGEHGREQDGPLEKRFDKRQWTQIDEDMLRRIMSYSILQWEQQPIRSDSGAQLVTGLAYPLMAGGSDLASELRFSYLFSNHIGGTAVLGTMQARATPR